MEAICTGTIVVLILASLLCFGLYLWDKYNKHDPMMVVMGGSTLALAALGTLVQSCRTGQ